MTLRSKLAAVEVALRQSELLNLVLVYMVTAQKCQSKSGARCGHRRVSIKVRMGMLADADVRPNKSWKSLDATSWGS